MAGISGQGTTFNLPNYVGELFSVTPKDTPFLSAIGGLTGGEQTTATLFQWQGYDLRDADESRQRLEGADAPTAEERDRFNVKNVVEIHHEAVEVSYTKQAATNQFASTGSNHPHAAGINGMNPVGDEKAFQVQRALEQIARDIERSFLVNALNEPSTNATARRSRGLIDATETNVVDAGTLVGTATIAAATDKFTIAAHGLANGDPVVVRAFTGGADGVLKLNTLYYVKAADANTFEVSLTVGGASVLFSVDGGAAVYEPAQLTKDHVDNLLQEVWENGGIQQGDTATIMVNGSLKRRLSKVYITDANYREQTRTMGGVAVTVLTTDFGDLNVMLNRHLPNGLVQVASLEECSPVFLNVPGKGFLFQEELAKVGSADRSQIYGEVGLKWGNERKHGKILAVKA